MSFRWEINQNWYKIYPFIFNIIKFNLTASNFTKDLNRSKKKIKIDYSKSLNLLSEEIDKNIFEIELDTTFKFKPPLIDEENCLANAREKFIASRINIGSSESVEWIRE